MSQFADLVEQHGDALLQRWESKIQRGHDAPSSSLRQPLPAQLRALIAALRRGAPEREPPVAVDSDAQAIVRECALLGGVLLDLAEESGAALSLTDVRAFTDFMAAAVTDGLAADVVAQSRIDREADEIDKLKDLFMTAPVPMCVIAGPLQIYTFANAAYLALVPGRELLGKPILEALPELRGQGFDELLARVMSSGEPHFGNETPALISTGAGMVTHYFNFVFQPRRSSDGVVNSVLLVGTDVTEQVQARLRLEAEAEALRRSEERLRRVVEATGAGMWELDLGSQEVTADAHLRALHGFPTHGPVGLAAALAAADPADRLKLQAAIQAAFDPDGARTYLIEYRVPDASGTCRWIEARGRAFFEEGGVPTRMYGTAVDITARKEAELAREGLLEALEAQPLLQVCVLEGTQFVVKLVNAEYRANVAGGRDIVGRPVLDAFPELAGQGFDVLMKQVLDSGAPHIGREVSTRLDRGDGVVVERFFNFVLQPVRGRRGTVDTLLNISHDVTHFVEARRAIESVAAHEKERADFERQLIGIVSHDLRNPLSTMRMGVTLLLDRELSDASLKVALRIQSSLDRMVRLVNDLLDFTQARLGTGLPIVRAPMNLHAVVAQVVDELQMLFPEREIALESEGDGLGLWDHDRVAQAAVNLITNALKYSPPRTAIRVSTRTHGDGVELEVFNSGEPIAPDILPRLFAPMQRGDSQAEVSRGSVGLGLFIVKHIAEALGGTIAVNSSAEAGNTFTLALPRA